MLSASISFLLVVENKNVDVACSDSCITGVGGKRLYVLNRKFDLLMRTLFILFMNIEKRV
jgi:hypothetical protein